MNLKIISVTIALFIVIGTVYFYSKQTIEVQLPMATLHANVNSNNSRHENSHTNIEEEFSEPSLAIQKLRNSMFTDGVNNTQKSLSLLELRTRLDAIYKQHPELNLTLEQLQLLIMKTNAWHTDESVAAALADRLKPNEVEDGRVFICFDPVKIATLDTGDILQMPLPHNDKTVTMMIEEVSSRDPKLTQWLGRLTEVDGLYPVHITQSSEDGETLTHVSISTPDASYLVEAFDDKGWIILERTYKIDGETIPFVMY